MSEPGTILYNVRVNGQVRDEHMGLDAKTALPIAAAIKRFASDLRVDIMVIMPVLTENVSRREIAIVPTPGSEEEWVASDDHPQR